MAPKSLTSAHMTDIIHSERETDNKDGTQLSCSRKQDPLNGCGYFYCIS